MKNKKLLAVALLPFILFLLMGVSAVTRGSLAVGGITGLGSGVATLLATFSGANLAAALTTAVPNTKGGTGGDSSGSTGLAHLLSGTWSYSILAGGDLAKQDVMDGPSFCAAAGASGTAYTCNLSPAITGYVNGTHYRFKADVANTGTTPSINFNGQGAKTLVKAAGGVTTALAANDLRAGQWIDVVYDNTNMQVQSTLGNAPAGSTPTAPAGISWMPFGGVTTAQGTTFSANVIRYFELPMLSANATFAKITAFASVQAGDLTVGIYDGSCNLITQGPTVTGSGTNTFLTFAITYTINANTQYFLAVGTDNASTILFASSNGYNWDLTGTGDSAGTYHYFTGSNALTGSTTLVLPATCGTRSSMTTVTPVAVGFH